MKRHSRSEWLRNSALVLCLFGLLPHALAAHSRYGRRMVFAHYMVTNQDYSGGDPEQKIAAYEKEIRQAQAIGIDGFALNEGGWLRQTYYIRYTAEMFEAAVRLHSGFHLMFSADMCCSNRIADVEDMMRRFANNPRYRAIYFHEHGRPVLTTFAGSKLGVAAWKQIRSDLAHGTHPSTTQEPSALATVSGMPSNAPMEIFLVPAFFWGGETPGRAAIQQGFDRWKSAIDGSFYWGIAGIPGSGGKLDTIRSSDSYASTLHAGHKLYMAPICLQFWGANANRYYEYSGASGMRKMWMDAIQASHPDWVEIITWNDFIEGTYVSPIDDPNKYPGANFLNTTGIPLGTRGYFHTHRGATALLKYFIAWYKTGVQPKIQKDAIYYFYRTQSKSYDAGTPPVAHKYGPVADVIYVTANLTAPAVLTVRSGKRATTLHLPAGSTDVQAPFATGSPPAFELTRKGVEILHGAGNAVIQLAPRYNDYYDTSGVLAASSAK
jgi:glucan endo-1,3-alpha-glucosidase